MMLKSTTYALTVLIAGALLVTGCSSTQSSSQTLYYDEPQRVYDAVEGAVSKLGMRVVEYEVTDTNNSFKMHATEDKSHNMYSRDAGAARLLRMYIVASRQPDGAYKISVDVPSSRNYASQSGYQLENDFFRHLNNAGLTTGESIASGEEESVKDL